MYLTREDKFLTIYIIMMAILSICSFIEVISCSYVNIQGKEKKKSYVTAIISYLTLLFVLVAHEEFMGVDSNNYKIMFEQASNSTWLELFKMKDIDYGYYSINKIISYITDDFWIFRGILHSITLGLMYFVVNRESKYPSLSVLIYITICSFYTFYILREALAISVAMLSYYFLKRDKYTLYFALVFLAATIHVTGVISILFIVVRLILKKRIKIYQLCMVSLMFSTVCYFGLVCVMSFYRSGRYIDMEKDGGFKLLIVLSIIMVILAYFLCQYSLKGKEISFKYNMLCCSFLIQVAALYAGILTRARFYFAVFMIFLIPDILGIIRNVRNRIVFFLLVICACWIWLFGVSNPYPYTFHSF